MFRGGREISASKRLFMLLSFVLAGCQKNLASAWLLFNFFFVSWQIIAVAKMSLQIRKHKKTFLLYCSYERCYLLYVKYGPEKKCAVQKLPIIETLVQECENLIREMTKRFASKSRISYCDICTSKIR